MIQSMTGFGRASVQDSELVISVEIRALNSRQTDIRFKLPNTYREDEIKMRNQLQQSAFRGKIDVTIERKSTLGGDLSQGINKSLFERYKKQLVELAPKLADDQAGLVTAILRMPNVVGVMEAEPSKIERENLNIAFSKALQEFIVFRETEGKAMALDLETNAKLIADTIPQIEAFEAKRIAKMKNRLKNLLDEHLQGTAIDQNRMEQEVLFYLEKIDITEEKVRLEQHCSFFLQKLNDEETEKGRRLNFITQEMGREINTLGAKAYSSDIQRLVVQMKESLEKIKEQIANIV